MKKVLKWLGFILGGLVGLLVLALAVVYLLSSSRINRQYEVDPPSVNVVSNAETIALGEHIATIRGCRDCHGENLSGTLFIGDPAIGTLYGTNLTPGPGGVSAYSDLDLVRAIRHGIDPDGRALLFMPSHEFFVINDTDLGALIAYLRSLPPTDNPAPEPKVGPLGRVLFLAGQFPLIPAEMIDHQAPRPEAIEPAVTTEYGEYLAAGCIGCHGIDYSGGSIPGAPPDMPPSSNLTPAGQVDEWTAEEFIQAMRSGTRPDGSQIDPSMPFSAVGKMSDDELTALWLFLTSLPAQE